MTKIRIPVEGVNDEKIRLAHLLMRNVIPMIAVALIIGFTFGRGVMLPKTDPRMQAAATLGSTQGTAEEESPITQNIVYVTSETATGSFEKNILEDTIAQNDTETTPASPQPESLLSTVDLDLSITDHETAITQLNKQIERVKDDSVALISVFNTNCGNWKDECAKPYAAALDINNSTYNDLVQKVTTLQRELDKFHAEKIARL